ncbi:ComEC/Rec2 family competence protein [Pseudobacteriovorax antillogorgiicola]|uniref:Competence protein n=1 Tax=Pseudobacteriovorax antillogorgiicola TaxID=1513793 RepID=A0A1Y6B7Y7_9BACT|nr:ComEC/Rec2 family competence protein [Pseudobacteriovorax antillogorgiicola]TCS59266.1 competence protein [Pseudobacteriovorax antillogorgiicola]SME89914.1 Competence protein [Pseudobacteriovorax antillogorgiicola]
MLEFIASFYIFALLAKHYSDSIWVGSLAWPIYPIAALIILYFRDRFHRVAVKCVTIALGAIWGWGSYRVQIPLVVNDCAVVSKQGLGLEGPWLVACSKGDWLAFADTKKGQIGVLTCSNRSCRFKGMEDSPVGSSLVSSWRRDWRARQAMVLDHQIPSDLLYIYRGVILGMSREYHYYKDLFKTLGIYHLLVLSGFHMSLVFKFVGGLVAQIPKSLYVLTLISPRLWRWVKNWVFPTQVSSVIIASYFLGFSVPCQRACLTSILGHKQWLGSGLSLNHRLLLVHFIHLFLAPYAALSMSFALTWLIYLVLVSRDSGKTWMNAVISQVMISAILLVFLPSITVLSILINLLLAPFFALLLSSIFGAYLWVTWGDSASYVFEGQRMLLSLFQWLDQFATWDLSLSPSEELKVLLLGVLLIKIFSDLLRKQD